MYAQFRPSHSAFETLTQQAKTPATSAYRRFQIVTNEQLSARGYGNPSRPQNMFSDFIQR